MLSGMRPGDHPDFFRFPAPEGRSRESTIRLDRTGRFFHDGALVEHPKLARALASWVSRHPDDRRYILTNGYDWTYFEVEDVPFFVHAVREQPDGIHLELTDGSDEWLRPEQTRVLSDGGVVTAVKHQAPGGPYEAKFQRAALVDLAECLEEDASGHVRLTRSGLVLGVR
jgi:hypothetical protein